MIFPNNIYLDTHAVIWLENGDLYRFGKLSLLYLENCHLLISPMVKLELQYLYQKKRVTEDAESIIDKITNKVDFSACQKNWLDIVNIALTCDFTRDVFDRLIVAHAMLDHDILISKDENLTKHYKNCVW